MAIFLGFIHWGGGWTGQSELMGPYQDHNSGIPIVASHLISAKKCSESC